jgi:hypothetical protein
MGVAWGMGVAQWEMGVAQWGMGVAQWEMCDSVGKGSSSGLLGVSQG